MMSSRKAAGWVGVAFAAGALALAPGIAASVTPAKKRAVAISLTAPGSLGSFTPAAANPRLAAAFSGSTTNSAAFRFTPASSAANRRGVTVAVRTRVGDRPVDARGIASTAPSLAPAAYNLGVSVGWKRFALSGDIAKVDSGLLPGHEAVDLGLTYSAPKWSTRLQLGTDRPTGSQPRLIGPEESVSADLSGSYALTRNLEVTGGVRYRLQRDRLLPLEDNRRDSQAVYLGTAFKF